MNTDRNVGARTRRDDYESNADLGQSIYRDEHQSVESRHGVTNSTVGRLPREIDRGGRTTSAEQPAGNRQIDKNETHVRNQRDTRSGSETDDEEEHERQDG